MMRDMIMITIALLCLFIIVFKFITSKKDRIESERKISNLNDFSPDIIEVFQDASALAIDKKRNKIAIIDVEAGKRHTSVFGFSDIIAVEICRDGETVTKTNRGSQVAGAAVGAVLLGPLGLLIGGLSGSKRDEEKISKLSLKIYTTNLKRPMREVVIFSSAPPIKAGNIGVHYGQKMEDWYGRLRMIMHKNQEKPKPLVSAV